MMYKNYLIKRTTKYGAQCWGVFQQYHDQSGWHITSYPVFTAKTIRDCKDAINCHFGRL